MFDAGEDKENCHPVSETPVSERPTEPPRLLISRLFGRWSEYMPKINCRTSSEYFCSVRVCNIIYNYLYCFNNITIFFQTSQTSVR